MFKKCPFCKQEIDSDAHKCTSCGRTLIEKVGVHKTLTENKHAASTTKVKRNTIINHFKKYWASGEIRWSFFYSVAMVCIFVYLWKNNFNQQPSPKYYQPAVEIAPIDFKEIEYATLTQPTTKKHILVSQETPPKQEVQTTELAPPVSLDNGTILENQMLSSGLGYININNGTDLDAEAKLVDISTDKAVFKVYIQAGQKYRIQKINDGDYKLVFGLGIDWDESLSKFNRDAEYQAFDETFPFSTYTTDDSNYRHTHYSTYGVTLNPVIGGSAKTSHISPNEFANY